MKKKEMKFRLAMIAHVLEDHRKEKERENSKNNHQEAIVESATYIPVLINKSVSWHRHNLNFGRNTSWDNVRVILIMQKYWVMFKLDIIKIYKKIIII